MTWISGMQRVLDYIEANLDGEINLDSLANLSESGTYHLQRSFSLLTGMTLTEYIRQRRLTVAASDLLRGMKVIDTAMKYGYDSQDGFARAFVRFLGILPCDIRDHSARLNACSPLHVNLTLKGGIMMEYAVFQTGHTKHPVEYYMQLRENIATDWLPGSGYTLRNAPELAIYHWYTTPDNNKKRYSEIWIPVEE